MATRSRRKFKGTDVLDITSYIEEIVGEFDEEVSEAVWKQIPDIAYETAEDISKEAPVRRGVYKETWDWEYPYKSQRLQRSAVIFSHLPGLPHLLEFGHQIKSGGRTLGRTKEYPHVKPAEETAADRLEKKIVEAIKNVT